MKFQEAFRGSFLKAADLGGTTKRYTIEAIGQEEIQDEKKIVVRFEGEDLGLVLNKTNANVLREAWGEELNDWVGQAVLLRPDKTDFQGKRVDCIRCAIPKKKSPAPAVTEEQEEEADDINV